MFAAGYDLLDLDGEVLGKVNGVIFVFLLLVVLVVGHI